MIYISYYTKNTPYENVINQYLIPSLKRWKLKYHIECVEDRGNWQKNTHIKAEIIKKLISKYKQSVVFLDADATIEQYPILFKQMLDFDIGIHFLDWTFLWRQIKNQAKREVLSGTLYLNYNEIVLNFLDQWIEKNKESIQWEQKNMEEVLVKLYNKLKIYNLPPEYACIIKYDGSIPKHYLKSDPVIIHHQVSRKFKK